MANLLHRQPNFSGIFMALYVIFKFSGCFRKKGENKSLLSD
jgi:hypothetical protein